MADQTHCAVDSLLGLLSTAIKDEARLLGGVQGDMQFIKDEMDSMNGFLLHLSKTETEHDDQLRAWMKQVRDIAYIAQDCIELYVRDVGPLRKGLWAYVRRVPMLPWTMPARHRLATKIRELKVRVRDVGERRPRYDVTVPRAELRQRPAAGQDNTAAKDESRAAFLRDLEDDGETGPPSFNKAISQLLPHIESESDTIRVILTRCTPDCSAMKMFLCALYAYPHGTKQELEKLKNKTGDHTPADVMIFCYSKLSTHYKSCLQYLTAFREEESISRTSLVRRWVAEGLVAKEEGLQTLEQAAEPCFNELAFRGFLHPSETGAAGKVKSCTIDEALWKFVLDISKSENFVGDLPTHLSYQLVIRDIVKRQQQRRHQKSQDGSRSNASRSICDLCIQRKPQAEKYVVNAAAAVEGKDPLDEMVELLKSLDPLYRLNVLDLGGCRGLRKSSLKTICKVLWLKYLSLRNTDVNRLPKKINNLRHLETLDIRQTEVRETDTEHIILPNLKHLLAGHVKDSSLSTVRIPRTIGTMRHMEILSHVQVFRDVELNEVGKIPGLKKLGVVLRGSKDSIERLLWAIDRLSECLRSLSIWIRPLTNRESGTLMIMEQTAQRPKHLESLNINGALGNEGLPNWINDLANLSKVTLCKTSLPRHSLQTLGKLKGLRCLRLRHKSFVEHSLAFTDAGFQILKFLLIEDDTITRISFENSTAPKLEKIVWWSTTSKDITSDMISGASDHPMLKVVEFKGHCNYKLRDPLKHAIVALPNPTEITEGPAENAGLYVTITATVEESKAASASV